MERARGITFAPGQLGYIDFECRSQVDLKSVGTDRYSRDPGTSASVLALALGDGQVASLAVTNLSQRLKWSKMPKALRDFHKRVKRGEAVYVAHNSYFDRSIWNHATDGFPEMEPEMIICSRVQASAAGLPAALALAAKYVGAAGKLETGKKLLKLFMFPGHIGEIATHPEEWQQLLEYARCDVEAMRGLFNRTTQLSLPLWRQFWTSERINDRGLGVDLELAEAAARMATIDKQRSAVELERLTDGEVTAVTQVGALREWLLGILPGDGRDILIKRFEQLDPETGEVLKPQKSSLERNRVERLLAYLQAQTSLSNSLQAAERALQIRLYGGSMTPGKFSKILDSHVDGVLRGQYVFGGASQTFRFSSKGVQIHNLARDPLSYELDAINSLLRGESYDDFAAIGDDTPVARKLSLLIRPTFVAAPGCAFAWSDFANIEARVLPWVSGDPKAQYRLDNFRAVDADPTIPDIYKVTAAAVLNVPIEGMTKRQRQAGKVVELAAGFGGSTNAMLTMAASYGMHMTEAEAKHAVQRWRKDNRWAVNFWGRHDEEGSSGVWGAVNKALLQPDTPFQAGLVTYIYGRRDGALYCRLPSRRYLIYRKIKWERVNEIDEDTGEIIAIKRELMFSRDTGRLKVWPGLMVENIVQAIAADCLRGVLVRAEEEGLATRAHTHDEVLVEDIEARIEATAESLREIMEQGFEWSTGLPLKADITIGRFYSKCEDSWGL